MAARASWARWKSIAEMHRSEYRRGEKDPVRAENIERLLISVS